MTRLAFPVTLFYDIAWNQSRRTLKGALLYKLQRHVGIFRIYSYSWMHNLKIVLV